jgi:hypothetical protein
MRKEEEVWEDYWQAWLGLDGFLDVLDCMERVLVADARKTSLC